MGHRLPTILGKAIDDVVKTLNEEASLFFALSIEKAKLDNAEPFFFDSMMKNESSTSPNASLAWKT